MKSLYHHPPFWLHDIPAGAKLAGLAIASIAAMRATSLSALAASLIAVASLYLIPRYRMAARLRALGALWPVAAAIFLSQYFVAGLESALAMTLRLTLMMLLADLVTLSTTMQAMMDAIQPILRPLRAIGLDTRRFAFAVSLTIRFVPLLLTQWQSMAEAWRARTGKRASIRLIAPFVASILRMSDHMAEALDARGFGKPEGNRR